MKTIFLHAGMPKTGTTSLQRYLFDNRQILAEQDFLLPQSMFEKGHCHLTWSITRNLYYSSKFGSVFDLLEEINNSTEKNIIITSEAIATLRGKPLLEIKEIFKEYDIKIVFFLRRQDEYIKSYFFEKVKQGTFSGNLKKFIMQLWWIGDYYSTIKRFEEIFGPKNILIYKYNRKTVLSNFFNGLGLNLKKFPKIDYKFNKSQNQKTVNLVRILNKLYFFLGTKNMLRINKTLFHNRFISHNLGKVANLFNIDHVISDIDIMSMYLDCNLKLKNEYDINLMNEYEN